MKIKEFDRLELAKAMRRKPDIKVIVETRKAQDRAERLNFGSCAFPECTSYAYARSLIKHRRYVSKKSRSTLSKGF